MTYEVVSEGDGPDYVIWTCDNCGRQLILSGVGGDVACCPCEFENEDWEDDPPSMTEREEQEAEIRRERIEMMREEMQLWDIGYGE